MPDSNWSQFMELTRKLSEATKHMDDAEKKLENRKIEKPVKEPKTESYYIVGEGKLTNILAILGKMNKELVAVIKQHEDFKKRIGEIERKLDLKQEMEELKTKLGKLRKHTVHKKKVIKKKK